MALFGSRSGLDWWEKVNDAEIEIQELKNRIKPIEDVLENLNKIRYMYDHPIYRENINSSISILNNYLTNLKNNIKSAEKDLEQIRGWKMPLVSLGDGVYGSFTCSENGLSVVTFAMFNMKPSEQKTYSWDEVARKLGIRYQ